jgi:hypothetical protein
VIVIGGRNDDEALSSTEIYDPASGDFEPGPLYPGGSPCCNSVIGATLLSTGRVLIIGHSIEEFDPISEEFIAIEDRPVDHNSYFGVTIAPLPEGGALLVERANFYAGTGGKAWTYAREPFPAGNGIDFGKVPVGSASGPQTLLVANRRGPELEIGGASLSGANAGAFTILADGCSGMTLLLGESCVLEVTAIPMQAGPLTAAVQLDDNALSSPHSFALAVEGIAQPKGPEQSGDSGTRTGSAPAGSTTSTNPAPTVSAKAKKPKRRCRKAAKRSHAPRCGKPRGAKTRHHSR